MDADPPMARQSGPKIIIVDTPEAERHAPTQTSQRKSGITSSDAVAAAPQAGGARSRLALASQQLLPPGFPASGMLDALSPASPCSPTFMRGRLDTFEREGGPLAKAERFQLMQLRSVLDQPGAPPDATWRRLLDGGAVAEEIAIELEVALPDGKDCEAKLLSSVEKLAEAFGSEESLTLLYKSFGWSSPEEYFAALGVVQVVMCDVDHNDSDDRLAIVLLAFQMASANACRRLQPAGGVDARCTLQLDVRSYQTVSGLSIFRTLRLAAVLTGELARHGLAVQVLVSDSASALQLMADYLELPPNASAEALDEVAAGCSHIFKAAVADLRGSWQPGELGTIWLLSGVCGPQARDIESIRERGVRLNLIEQAQPAWQSFTVTSHEGAMPDWEFPPPDLDPDDKGFGAEPSNVRSGEGEYVDVVADYFRLQRALGPAPPGAGERAPVRYLAPALARQDDVLPTPPGQQMLCVSGRTLTVVPGEIYRVRRAADKARAAAAFEALLAAADAAAPETLGRELRVATADDRGEPRPQLAHILKYGTFMSDAIIVAVAARPQLETTRLTRRLAFAFAGSMGDIVLEGGDDR